MQPTKGEIGEQRAGLLEFLTTLSQKRIDRVIAWANNELENEILKLQNGIAWNACAAD